ncbi:MAG: family 1 glycosylhydrolase [Thomasclavelia ramosa]
MSKRLNKKVPTGFPNHFLWGGAVAANQCEGAYLIDGKQMSTADIKARGFFGGIRRDADYYPTHNAIDFYHTYREDLKLMSDANFNIFRTSINWTRIYPTGVENEPNMKGIEFYKDMFEYCHQLGMKVMVTISHYETPLYLVDNYGGVGQSYIYRFLYEVCKNNCKLFR